MPEVGWKMKLGSTSPSVRTIWKRAYTSEQLRSLMCFVTACPVSTVPTSTFSVAHVRNGYLPMPPILSTCALWPGTLHTQLATYTDASRGRKVTSTVACWRGCTVPEDGTSVKGAS